jgi:hypothetical protein
VSFLGLINVSSPGLTGGSIRKTLKNGFPLEFTLEKSGAGVAKRQHARVIVYERTFLLKFGRFFSDCDRESVKWFEMGFI